MRAITANVLTSETMAERDSTRQNKKAFLGAFRLTGVVTTACEAARISRATVYRWQEEDAQFAYDFRQAEIESTELLETEAIRRAREGVVKETPIHHNGKIIYTVVEHKYSDNLLMFMLKGRKPETYRDNVNMDVTSGGQPLSFTLEIAHAALSDADSDGD